MAAASTHFTAKVGEEKFEAQVTSGVTTRAENLSEPANTDDIEVIFLESTVTTKEQALLLLEAVRQQIHDSDWLPA